MTGNGLGILLRLADIDRAIRLLPPKEYQAILLYGQLKVKNPEKVLGCSKQTVLNRFDSGIAMITNYLNTGDL